ncbi:MAG TPA: FecR domain-containing protein, partial [Patescibacteria group bacterium]|nr:FecR domain-containing protein [Patescibacteria group bacterium]
MKRINALVILAITVLFASPTHAQQQQAAAPADDPTVIGTLIEVEGSATMTRPGQSAIVAASEMPVHMNDVIDTAAGAKADILFIDNTEVTLGEKAELKVDEYVYDPENMNSNKGRFSIPQGPFQFVTGQIDKVSNPDVKISTAYGAIGVRGTTIVGGNVDDSYGIFV